MSLTHSRAQSECPSLKGPYTRELGPSMMVLERGLVKGILVTEDTLWRELNTTLTEPWLVPTKVSGSKNKTGPEFLWLPMSPTSRPFSAVL